MILNKLDPIFKWYSTAEWWNKLFKLLKRTKFFGLPNGKKAKYGKFKVFKLIPARFPSFYSYLFLDFIFQLFPTIFFLVYFMDLSALAAKFNQGIL